MEFAIHHPRAVRPRDLETAAINASLIIDELPALDHCLGPGRVHTCPGIAASFRDRESTKNRVGVGGGVIDNAKTVVAIHTRIANVPTQNGHVPVWISLDEAVL